MKYSIDLQLFVNLVRIDAIDTDTLELSDDHTLSVKAGVVGLTADALTADSDGRAVFEDDFFDETTVDDKFEDDAINGGKLKDSTVEPAKLTEIPFHATFTLTSAAAATPVSIIDDADVPAGKKVYLQGYILKVDGATDWGTTASVKIQDTNGTPVDFVTLTASALDGNEVHGPWSDSAALEAAFCKSSGGTTAKGLQIVGNANGTGSSLVGACWGVIK
jgi:hypothetical protein